MSRGTYISIYQHVSILFKSVSFSLQTALSADPPHRSLRIGLAGSGSGGMGWNTRRQEMMDFGFTEVRSGTRART